MIFKRSWMFAIVHDLTIRKFQILHMVKGGNLDMDKEPEREYNAGHANREAIQEIILDQKNVKNMGNGYSVDPTR